MLTFKKLNVNPKNRKTGDCSIRALAYLLDIKWEEALTLLYEEAIKTKYDTADRKNMESVLNKCGYVKMKQPRMEGNLKYPLYRMDEVLSKQQRQNKVLCNVANHYVVIDNDNIVDSWDSSCKCCGNYFVKVR